ncbi:MAG: hypothetical protein KDJ47_01765 [Hyphomicrobiaceae bacterium]|nr:hypothetical protein [Hyphomicrobiaceae bacterium]
MKTANQAQLRARPVTWVRALRPKGLLAMLGFLLIFSASLAGYAGVAPWAIAAAAIGLASISYTQYHRLYERGQELGYSDLVDATIVRSFFNALVASGGAYGFGWLVHAL